LLPGANAEGQEGDGNGGTLQRVFLPIGGDGQLIIVG
jgi:hypothetical protein